MFVDTASARAVLRDATAELIRTRLTKRSPAVDVALIFALNPVLTASGGRVGLEAIEEPIPITVRIIRISPKVRLFAVWKSIIIAIERPPEAALELTIFDHQVGEDKISSGVFRELELTKATQIKGVIREHLMALDRERLALEAVETETVMAPKERAPGALSGKEPESLVWAKRSVVRSPDRDALTEGDLIPSAREELDHI